MQKSYKNKCEIACFTQQPIKGFSSIGVYLQINHMSRNMRFPTMWYVWPAKPQINLRIRAVWSMPLLVAWIFYECYTTDWTWFGVSKIKRRLHRLVWVYTCQNTTLSEITCRGSIISVATSLLSNSSVSARFGNVGVSDNIISLSFNMAAVLLTQSKTEEF